MNSTTKVTDERTYIHMNWGKTICPYPLCGGGIKKNSADFYVIPPLHFHSSKDHCGNNVWERLPDTFTSTKC